MSQASFAATAAIVLAGLFVGPTHVAAQDGLERPRLTSAERSPQGGTFLDVSGRFATSTLEEGRLTRPVSVSTLARAIEAGVSGAARGREGEQLACGAVRVQSGRAVAVHLSRPFSVSSGEPTVAGRYCLPADGFVPGGSLAPGDLITTDHAFMNVDYGDFFDQSTPKLDPDCGRMISSPCFEGEAREALGRSAVTVLPRGVDGLVLFAVPADVRLLSEVPARPFIVQFGERR